MCDDDDDHDDGDDAHPAAEEYHEMQRQEADAKKAALREARGEISAEDVGGLPEGFKGTTSDLFSLLLAEESTPVADSADHGAPQSNAAEPKAQEAQDNAGKGTDDEDNEELPELRTNNEQLIAWHDRCTHMLECRTAAVGLPHLRPLLQIRGAAATVAVGKGAGNGGFPNAT